MVRLLDVAVFYGELKKAAVSASSSPVRIYPSAADTDSVCALRIVTDLLRSDSIRYSVFPVASVSDFQSKYAETIQSEESSYVVMLINWGASLNLLNVLKPGVHSLVFVVDSHRPVSLQNLNTLNKRIVVLYTADDQREADMAYPFNLMALAEDCDPEDSELAEDGDYDSDWEEYGHDKENNHRGAKRKRQSRGRRYGGQDEDDDDDDGNDGEDEQVPEAREHLRKQIKEYYSKGTFHGKPSGCLMFDLSHALHKNTNELLWLACVSLADQFVHERLTAERYAASMMELENHVNSAGNLEMGAPVTLTDGTRVPTPDNSRIVLEDEPRLMLLREWSLYESMECSTYVATKLKTWSDNGLKTLKLHLANMGISLLECQQRFQYMTSGTKRRLKEEFEKIASKAGLTDLYYRSFQRRHGYGTRVPAADVVHAVTALLESGKGDEWESSFFKALTALAPSATAELQAGIRHAISVQQATLRQGKTAISTPGFIRMTKAFRWFKLDDGSDNYLLARPLTLTKLCYFLMDALRETGRKIKPIVGVAYDPGSTLFLIVGVSHRPRLGAQEGNMFGRAFRRVARDLQADYQHDAFESSWLRLDGKAVTTFMQKLSERLTLAERSR